MANNHIDANAVNDEDAYIGPVTAREEELLQHGTDSNNSTQRHVRFRVKNLWGDSVRVVLPSTFESMAYVCHP